MILLLICIVCSRYIRSSRRRMSKTDMRFSTKTQPQTPKNKTRKNNNRRRRNRRRINRRTNSWIRTSFAPMTIGTTTKIFSNLTQRGNTARLDFCELFSITIPSSGLSNLIFINPAKWINTRTYDQARLYTQFRPQYLHIEFISNVATSTPGLVSFGSYYSTSHPDYNEDLFLRLPQTEGGFITSVWQSTRTNVRCGTALSQNKYGLQSITEEDIPITLVTITKDVPGDIGSTIGYLALSGAFLLTGPRTSKEDQNVSGDYNAQVEITNNTPVLVVEDRFHCFVPDQEVSLKVTDVNEGDHQLTDVSGNKIDFKKIFKIFTTVLGKVISVVGTVAKIALAVAPIILAQSQLTTINTLTSVSTSIIGKLPEGSVDIGSANIPSPTQNIIIMYPPTVLPTNISNEQVVFRENILNADSMVTFTIANNKLHFVGSSYYDNTEAFQVTLGDTNWHNIILTQVYELPLQENVDYTINTLPLK